MRVLNPERAIKYRELYLKKLKRERPDYITPADVDAAIAEARQAPSMRCLPKYGGVYVLAHKATGKAYIGRGVNMRTRMQVHITELRAGRHICKALQADFDAYGADAFGVAVLTCTRDDWSSMAERAAIRVMQSRSAYNSAGIVISPMTYLNPALKAAA